MRGLLMRLRARLHRRQRALEAAELAAALRWHLLLDQAEEGRR